MKSTHNVSLNIEKTSEGLFLHSQKTGVYPPLPPNRPPPPLRASR